MKKSYNVISVMLSRLAFVCKRVLAKCGFNCFKAAEHRGDSREANKTSSRMPSTVQRYSRFPQPLRQILERK